MRRNHASDAYYLLAFFAFLILIGSLVLSLPLAWSGTESATGPLSFIDALFTAASAVCVTGLVTVDCGGFSRFGQATILVLIQLGGLGIISFTSILMTIPGGKLPLRRLNTIRGFSVDGVEYDPARIVRDIMLFTFGIEALGGLALALAFGAAGAPDPLFAGLFHSVSAFCNAGFSLTAANLEPYAENVPILAIVSILIVLGGIGFIVLQDVERRIRGKRRRLSYHTKVVLGMTGFLVAASAAAFFLLERGRAYAAFGPLESGINAIFQAITPRTAGFDAVPQAALCQPSKALTIALMFVGGAPGSIAGGIKVTTAFAVAAVMLRRTDGAGDVTVFKRRLSATTLNSAVVYFLKATALLIASAGALSLIEGLRGADLGAIVFESVSAFGTVGLSLGLTSHLSVVGKLIIIATMFAGRVGLIALAFPSIRRDEGKIAYPAGSILLG